MKVDGKPASVAQAPEASPAVPPPAPTQPSAPSPPVSQYIVVPAWVKPPEPPSSPVIRLPDSVHLSKGILAGVLGPAPTLTGLPPPAPPSHPRDVPMPAHLQEHIDGNTYFNDTFQFSMFRPPDWKIYEGVPKETGSGVMAMGTEDEQTLLISWSH